MSAQSRHDPVVALNQVLSEVIDEVAGVKQARLAVPGTHPLHAVLDDLFADLRRWAELLIEEDAALGVSPLAVMPSVAGRKPVNLWPGGADDAEVRRVIGEHLDRLEEHVAAALDDQDDEEAGAPLAEMNRGLSVYKQALHPSAELG